MPLIPTLGRQKQAELWEFKVSLVYEASSKTGSKAAEKPSLEKKQKTKTKMSELTWLSSQSKLDELLNRPNCY